MPRWNPRGLSRPSPYTPRDPGNSVIAKVLEAHLDDLLEGVDLNAGDRDPERSVPTFVDRELPAIMDSGLSWYAAAIGSQPRSRYFGMSLIASVRSLRAPTMFPCWMIFSLEAPGAGAPTDLPSLTYTIA